MASITFKPSSDVSVALEASAAGSHYALVSDGSNSTYVYAYGSPGGGTDRYGAAPVSGSIPTGSTITAVVLSMAARIIEAMDASATARALVGETVYAGATTHGLDGTQETDLTESRSWVPADFDDLDLGCTAYVYDPVSGDEATVYDLWLTVTYTPPAAASGCGWIFM